MTKRRFEKMFSETLINPKPHKYCTLEGYLWLNGVVKDSFLFPPVTKWRLKQSISEKTEWKIQYLSTLQMNNCDKTELKGLLFSHAIFLGLNGVFIKRTYRSGRKSFKKKASSKKTPFFTCMTEWSFDEKINVSLVIKRARKRAGMTKRSLVRQK